MDEGPVCAPMHTPLGWGLTHTEHTVLPSSPVVQLVMVAGALEEGVRTGGLALVDLWGVNGSHGNWWICCVGETKHKKTPEFLSWLLPILQPRAHHNETGR